MLFTHEKERGNDVKVDEEPLWKFKSYTFNLIWKE